MNITARLTGTADLARLDVTRLRDRLIAAIKREQQTDAEARRRFSSPLRGEGGAP